MGIKKTRLLVRESMYWINMKTDIENAMRQCITCLQYQQTQLHDKMIPYELPCRLWKVFGVDNFMINNKMLLCTVDYYRKFPVVRKVGKIAAGDLVQMTKMIFAECGLPKKIISDTGINIISEMFR